jgi:exodeoxyribonuclease-5
MSDITLSDKQFTALRDIRDWFRNGTADQQVFRLFGYAGTGKSTIVKFALDELGLDEDEALQACFTGKAAYVLQRKSGMPCSTIHRLIYRVHDASEAEIAEARQQLEELETAALALHGAERVTADAEIAALQMSLKGMRQPRFGLNEESKVRDCGLVVLDEVSMVGPDMASDLMSFGKPILVLGDPGQLPPIKGAGAFTLRAPDVMLTEIHRQAAESAVIRLATMARQGQPIPHGQHDQFAWKMRWSEVSPAEMLRGGQVICGLNKTRFSLNNAMRKAAGFNGSALPTGPGEKIICLKNDHALGLLNGMFLELDQIQQMSDEVAMRAVIKSEEGEFIGGVNDKGKLHRLGIYVGHFLDHEKLDPQRDDRDWKVKKRLIEATFGWAITGHKAQGSQWENVIVVDDGWGRSREQRAQWLYTAITRAESGLVILD